VVAIGAVWDDTVTVERGGTAFLVLLAVADIARIGLAGVTIALAMAMRRGNAPARTWLGGLSLSYALGSLAWLAVMFTIWQVAAILFALSSATHRADLEAIMIGSITSTAVNLMLAVLGITCAILAYRMGVRSEARNSLRTLST
jgi:hypothetical protein